MKNILTYAVLMLLLWSTYQVAHFKLGILNTPISLLIASIKAVLVATVFMHLTEKKGMVRVAALSGVFWLTVFIALAMSDFSTRTWLLLP